MPLEARARKTREGVDRQVRPAPPLFLTVGLAMVWTLLGIAKLAAPTVFLSYVQDSLSLDTVTAHALAWALILGEVILGAVMLVSAARQFRRIALATLFVSLIVALSIVGLLMAGPPERSCGCFGAALEATYSRRLIVASIILFVSATLIIDAGRGSGEGS